VRRAAAVVALALCACRPDTTRPSLRPLPEAAFTEIRLPTQEATRQLAEALRADSLPPSRVRIRDGYIETAWLDSGTGRPTRKRPLGADVVRIRAWADPARPGNTLLTVETLYRPMADPSRPERELDRQVPKDHPLALRVQHALETLLKRYGGPPPPQPKQPAAPAGPAPAEEEGEE
jgi:hypothetical protein